jgi:sec-independent protein translocase protein TatA
MFNLGPGELVVILLILLLLFGAKRLPEIGRSIGKSLGEFKKGVKESEDPFRNVTLKEHERDDEKR